MIQKLVKKIKDEINNLNNLDEKVSAINDLRAAIADVSPFQEPVDYVRWVPADRVHANYYNPNKVANPEMKLLHESIKLDGYTQPIVAYKLENSHYEVVDGFHRNRIGKEYKDIGDRIHHYLPLTIIDKPLDERIGSTIRHNRARGTHQIQPMSDVVADLVNDGWSDERICKELGMEPDEIVRLKQSQGAFPHLFQNHIFSKSWTEFENKYYTR